MRLMAYPITVMYLRKDGRMVKRLKCQGWINLNKSDKLLHLSQWISMPEGYQLQCALPAPALREMIEVKNMLTKIILTPTQRKKLISGVDPDLREILVDESEKWRRRFKEKA